MPYTTTHVNRSLTGCLVHLNKEDLHRIRRTIDVKNASALNKADLVQCLSDAIPEKIDFSLSLMDKKRFQMIQQVIDAGGSLSLDEITADDYFEPLYFQDYGLLFVDWHTRSIRIPVEVEAAIRGIDEVWLRHTLRRNTEWIRLTMGMLYYYGTVSVRKLIELIGRYTEQPDYVTYFRVIQDYADYDHEITVSTAGFSHYKVDDPEQVRQEHELRPTVDYFPFTREQLLRAAEDDYMDRTPEQRELVRFISQHLAMDFDEAEFWVEELMDLFQNGASLGDLVGYLNEELEFGSLEHIQQLVDRLVRLMNNSRQWFLKGYKPVELSRMREAAEAVPVDKREGATQGAEVYSFMTRKKVGRNDPCPCGSGKKFKKCCGG